MSSGSAFGMVIVHRAYFCDDSPYAPAPSRLSMLSFVQFTLGPSTVGCLGSVLSVQSTRR
jgi:hypothetical protein